VGTPAHASSFDHHDLCPELYEGQVQNAAATFLYRLMLRLERWTFRSADISIATNEFVSAGSRYVRAGECPAERMFVVRSGPVARTDAASCRRRPELRCRGGRYLVGYVGRHGARRRGSILLLRARRGIFVYTRGRTELSISAWSGGGTSLKGDADPRR